MFNKIINIEIKPSTKILVVSDIHLQLPVTQELGMIQKSLAERIDILGESSDAILVLNGDVIELWEQHGHSVGDILKGFPVLSESIASFAKKNGHSVVYTVGNHDDTLALSESDRKIIEKKWSAKVCRTLEFKIRKKIIRIEHGHESDSFNATSDNANPKGKKLVQNVLPILTKTMPSLFKGIGDVVNRSLLPSFVLSNLVYKMIAPICAPIIIAVSVLISLATQDSRYWKAAIIVLVLLWVVLMISDAVIKLIAGFVLGGKSAYLRKVDTYHNSEKFDVIIYGHTHQGAIEKRKGYIYANDGCNDIVALPRIGWLGLVEFNKFVQLSHISLDSGKKDFIKYHQHFIPLVE